MAISWPTLRSPCAATIPNSARCVETPEWHVDAARGPSTPSLDHLVGAGEQCRRNVKADRLGRLQVDDELKFGGQLDRHFGWLLALEDAADVDGRLAILVLKIRSVAHQPTSFGKLAPMVQRRQRMAHRQRDELHAT